MPRFSKNFMIGAATAAHQVEGNNISSDCWVMEQLPHSIYKEKSLDAVDHYRHYEEDIRLLAEAGLNAFRFSIEWARIQPEPDLWEENEIEHYRNVIKCCRKNGVEPIITMHHFSSPKWLIQRGGWENPKTADLFASYCEYVVKKLGEDMCYVCTINEANMGLQLGKLIRNRQQMEKHNVQVGLNTDSMKNRMLSMKEAGEAFGVDPQKINMFLSPRTVFGDGVIIEAHRKARNAMKVACPHLKIGLTLSLHDFQALPGGEHRAEIEWIEEFIHYLPYIDQDDFIGVQCYTRKLMGPEGVVQPDETALRTQMGYEDYPAAVVNVTRKVAEHFQGDIIITENGISTADDNRRIEFIREVIDGLKGCVASGIPLKGYLHWSLLDNFEWQLGFARTFGLIAVDRSTQIRYPKDSLSFLGSQR